MDKFTRLKEILSEKILILDGGMGTMIKSKKLNENDFKHELFPKNTKKLKANYDLLNLSKPDVIENIHLEFLKSGSNIIATNSFNSNAISQSNYKTEHLVEKLNISSVEIAKKSIERHHKENPESIVFIAGSVGPTNKSVSMSPDIKDPSRRDIDFDSLHEAYKIQISALLKSGIDLLLIETVYDSLNGKAAIYTANQLMKELNIRVPIVVSATITEETGKLISGQSLEAFVNSLNNPNIIAFGLNCSFGADKMISHIQKLGELSDKFICAYPNAGLPNKDGSYNESPESLFEKLKICFEKQEINIIGGCCGTRPEHIRKLAEETKVYKPRLLSKKENRLKLSGLEMVIHSEKALFASNIKVDKKYAPDKTKIIDQIKFELKKEHQIIKLNLDELGLESNNKIKSFFNLFSSNREVNKSPLILESKKWENIIYAAKHIQGKPILRCFPPTTEDEDFINKVLELKYLNLAIAIKAVQDTINNDSLNKKIDRFEGIFNLLSEIEFEPNNIIFDLSDKKLKINEILKINKIIKNKFNNCFCLLDINEIQSENIQMKTLETEIDIIIRKHIN
ncbi:MAG: homocysteine S-methyltransferase family protein [Marinifilaceae bacterium]|jgi:5-methyltetrahydrofolate--homocysteine methyltransferase|nr:homocysteine S-methyltransferase family protein [Marinifilaceae bacterium]